ncbi:hypothetical protein GVX82_00950 [Patescibacteria group bacterium]|jgi:hypothetical protein|nr:hypothetical protein [Patescibacteria group bacterium]
MQKQSKHMTKRIGFVVESALLASVMFVACGFIINQLYGLEADLELAASALNALQP